MKGYYEPTNKKSRFGRSLVYVCSHPLYRSCTLFQDGSFGVAVIQQRFNEGERLFWWGPIDPWLAEDIRNAPRFDEAFFKYCGVGENGIFPTVTVRKFMYAAGLKPMKKAYWEKEIGS